MLVQENRVSGILDFEFCGRDLRAFDLAVGALAFGTDWSRGGFRVDEALVAAFARGYQTWIRLSPEEVHAIPDLLRLRSTVSVLHRLGRYRARLASLDDVTSRMREGLRLDIWLNEHATELVTALSGTPT